DKTLKAHLLEITNEERDAWKGPKGSVTDITPDEISAMRSAAEAKPQFDALIHEVAFKHGAQASPAYLKSLGGRGGARDKVYSVAVNPDGSKGDGYGGDWSQIKDLVRGRILTKDRQQMEDVKNDLVQRLGMEPKHSLKKEGYEDY